MGKRGRRKFWRRIKDVIVTINAIIGIIVGILTIIGVLLRNWIIKAIIDIIGANGIIGTIVGYLLRNPIILIAMVMAVIIIIIKIAYVLYRRNVVVIRL